MRPLLPTAAAPLLALALSACAAPPAPPAPPLKVFKAIGSKQCEGGGQPLPVLARELSGAGIAVLTSRCGSDGRMYPAVCGGADGRIAIFEVAAADAAAAARLGFQPLAAQRDARETPCP